MWQGIQTLLRAGAVLVAAVTIVAPATAALPKAGVLVPGTSLAGLEIGMTKADVRARWGSDFGRCRGCPAETWYYTYRRFQPQGAAVSFSGGRVARVYTLWQPRGWRSTSGLVLGASEQQVTAALPRLPRAECTGYAALTSRTGRTSTVYYLHDGTLWGFGLIRAGLSSCL